jgi:hypothetical protein
MSDAVVHSFNLASRSWLTRIAERAGRSLCRLILARATRRALSRLPDDLLGISGSRGAISPMSPTRSPAGTWTRRAMRPTGWSGSKWIADARGADRCRAPCASRLRPSQPLWRLSCRQGGPCLDAQIKCGRHLVTLESCADWPSR